MSKVNASSTKQERDDLLKEVEDSMKKQRQDRQEQRKLIDLNEIKQRLGDDFEKVMASTASDYKDTSIEVKGDEITFNSALNTEASSYWVDVFRMQALEGGNIDIDSKYITETFKNIETQKAGMGGLGKQTNIENATLYGILKIYSSNGNKVPNPFEIRIIRDRAKRIGTFAQAKRVGTLNDFMNEVETSLKKYYSPGTMTPAKPGKT